VRLFIAIGLPESWKQILALPEASIGWLGKGVKWVEPRGMHLTLRFLGEVDERILPSIQTGIAVACQGIRPFELRMSGTGVFPTPKRPRVYWAGLTAGAQLATLQSNIEREMRALGFEPDEHAFSAHLTLARVKEPTGKERITEALLNFKIESEPFTANEVLLMRSHLAREGAHYEAVAKFPLTNN
jgi:RNA 2',3'-cyclic 3'-phosphodiesterase